MQQTINGVTRLLEQPQTDGFLLALRLLFMLIPIVLLVLALIIIVVNLLSGRRGTAL